MPDKIGYYHASQQVQNAPPVPRVPLLLQNDTHREYTGCFTFSRFSHTVGNVSGFTPKDTRFLRYTIS